MWFAVAGVFLGAIFIYVLFMIFLPEWVGITGNVAREAERSHKSGEIAKDDDLIANLQKQKDKSLKPK